MILNSDLFVVPWAGEQMWHILTLIRTSHLLGEVMDINITGMEISNHYTDFAE